MMGDAWKALCHKGFRGPSSGLLVPVSNERISSQVPTPQIMLTGDAHG